MATRSSCESPGESSEQESGESSIIDYSRTPRRSPRIAATRQKLTFHTATISSPLKECLRQKMGIHSILDNTKQFVTGKYTTLDAQIVKAAVETNKVAHFLVIAPKVRSYDSRIGPYDSLKVVVKENGSFSLLVHDKVMEEGVVESTLLPSSSIIKVLDKLADPNIVVCSGIQEYSTFKGRIGYDMKRVFHVNFPPDSVHDIDCSVIFEDKATQRKTTCSKCMSLKWELARRKREHDNLTQSQVKEQQSSSSHVPYDALSPCSKKARFENMRDTIHRLKSKVEYFSRKIERLSTCDKQNNEIGISSKYHA